MTAFIFILLSSIAITEAISIRPFVKAKVKDYKYYDSDFETSAAKSKVECGTQCLALNYCLAFRYFEGKCTVIYDYELLLSDDAGPFTEIYAFWRAHEFKRHQIKSDKLLLVGGYAMSSSIVLDLKTLEVCNEHFENYNDTDLPYQFGTGAVLSQKYPVLCPGTFDNQIQEACRVLNHPTISETPKLFYFNDNSYPKLGTAAVLWDSDTIWLTGGAGTSGLSKNGRLIFNSGKTLGWGRELPYPVSDHCLVRLDYKTFVLVGGKGHEHSTQIMVWQDNSDYWNEWMSGPDTIYPRHSDFACTVFEYQGVPTVMVGGGKRFEGDEVQQEFVEFLKQGSWQWVEGKVYVNCVAPTFEYRPRLLFTLDSLSVSLFLYTPE